MAEKKIYGRAVQKHDVEANWLKATNFIPMQGEIIVYDRDDNVTDESLKGTYSYERIKIGDGVQNVNDLPFASVEAITNDEIDEICTDFAIGNSRVILDEIGTIIGG